MQRNMRPLTGSLENSLKDIGGLILPATASAALFFGAIMFRFEKDLEKSVLVNQGS